MFCKRNIVICIILFLLVGGGVIYFLFFSKNPVWNIAYHVSPEVPKDTYTGALQEAHDKAQSDADTYNTAMSRQDVALCHSIKDQSMRDECHDIIIAERAKKSGAIEDCQNITHTGRLTLCQDINYSERATKAKNPLLCNKVSDVSRKSECINATEDILLRAYIDNHTLTRAVCSDFLSEKYQNLCLAQVDQVDESALYRRAIAENSIALCQTLQQGESRTLCLDTVVLKTAIQDKNTSLCQNISDIEKQRYCTKTLSTNNDVTTYKSALSTNDLALCRTITTDNLRKNCNDTVIITRVKNEKNTALCSELYNTGIIANCKNLVLQ